MKVLTLPLKYLPRLGLYSWYEWCCLFHPTGRLVIKTHAKPNLGQSFKLEIGSPSQVSTRFIHWFFFLLPSQSYSSQESSCLGRCNSLVTSRRNFLAVFDHSSLTFSLLSFTALISGIFQITQPLWSLSFVPSPLIPPGNCRALSSATILIQTMTQGMTDKHSGWY